MNSLMQQSPDVRTRDYEVVRIDFRGQAEHKTTFLTAFLVLVAAYCAWVFSLPLFPTQDDAMHLYYTKVTQHLLFHSPRFGAAYLIRIPPPPYVVHYALLLVLTSFLEP